MVCPLSPLEPLGYMGGGNLINRPHYVSILGETNQSLAKALFSRTSRDSSKAVAVAAAASHREA